MLIQNILMFIEDLKGLRDLISCDIHLYSGLVSRFGCRAPDEQLTVADTKFVLECFKKRWLRIVDTENDYMLNAEMANQKWIQLAKDLAPFTYKSYLQILIPSLTNTVDFNNLSLLTETVRLENFYLGQDNKVLYRKRGLCEHLIEQQFVLSTCRTLRTRKLNAMSVEELSRLQSSRQKKLSFR